MSAKKKTTPIKKTAKKAVKKTPAKKVAKKTTPKAKAAVKKKSTAVKKSPAKKKAVKKSATKSIKKTAVKKTAVAKKAVTKKKAAKKTVVKKTPVKVSRVALASKVSDKLKAGSKPQKKAVRKTAAKKKSAAKKKNPIALVVKKRKRVNLHPAANREYTLPENYGDNTIYCMVRDPEWIYVYWEIQSDYESRVLAELGGSFDSVQSVLRVYDITSDTGFGSYFDIPLDGSANSWFIRVQSNHNYVVELGLRHHDGRYRVLLKSNYCEVPRGALSDVVDENWMGLDAAKVYALSGGMSRGSGSEDISFLLERLKEHHLSSGSGASHFPKPEK